MIKERVSRTSDHRAALLRNLATSVILYETVTTTVAKARAAQPVVERAIRLAQQYNDRPLAIRRRLLGYLTDKQAVDKVINEIAPRYTDVTSGFTRRLRLGTRLGDNAEQAVLQLTRNVITESPAKTEQSTSKKSAKPAAKAKAEKADDAQNQE